MLRERMVTALGRLTLSIHNPITRCATSRLTPAIARHLLVVAASAVALVGCDPDAGTPRQVEPEGEDREDTEALTCEEFDAEVERAAPVPPAPAACDGGCIPEQVYGQAAALEYYNECRNYCHADDHCFDRAGTMLGRLDELCAEDIRGADGQWCGEFAVPSSTGTCDDLAFKVIIRYPCGEKWGYHIASMVDTCESGQCVIDPLGPPTGSPTTSCVSPQDWCAAHSHGHQIEWHDTDDAPPAGKVYCEVAPGDQSYYRDGSTADPTDPTVLGQMCSSVESHVQGLCAAGLSPFPSCVADADDDGVPDDYDKCPGSAPGVAVDYCDPNNLGCALPGGATCGNVYTIGANWQSVADADYDGRAVTGRVEVDGRFDVDMSREDLRTQCMQPDAATSLHFELDRDLADDVDLKLVVQPEGTTSAGRTLLCAGWVEAPPMCTAANGACTCDLDKGELDAWLAEHSLSVDIVSSDRNLTADGRYFPAVADPPLACQGG